MVATLEVEEAAEACVVAALRRLHLTVVQPASNAPGVVIIEAWKTTQHILLEVKAAVARDKPVDLTPQEKRDLRQRATRAGAEPWEAKVVLGPDGELVGLDWWPVE